ncbi:uncharacterized protein LODBEIA_P27850 [Lodderomyces beijingensis]|uniref:1,3-beta-glucanosyltransferase n=1 Tax=Lodderomyces beijingensis TaxID=1775926 RepID=A0ABP0ZK90_9ASCO
MSSSIEPIKVIGNKFYGSLTHQQFFIKGIAYQKTRQEGEVYDPVKETNYIDPMSNPFSCLRDLEHLKELGINLVRIYQINPLANHNVCMDAFAEAGIYVLADLGEPYCSIRRDFPHWDTELLQRYKAVIDAMVGFDNLLGFFAGNEVADSQSNVDSAPFVRAAIRDVKKYMRDRKYRKVPVGYATNDDATIREYLANYFVCDLNDPHPDHREDEGLDSKADFFAINVYEWCGYSTYTTSGYRELTAAFKNYPVPAFFSEFGCNMITPRPFTEVEALYGSTMRKTWSGGIAYEYFEEVNHYGIVLPKQDGSVLKLPDFETLKNRFNSAQPPGLPIDQVEKNEPVSCMQNAAVWQVASKLPQTPDKGKCECLFDSLNCVVVESDSFDEEAILRDLCYKIDCEHISTNGKLGRYGKFSDCESIVRASYALNKYYEQTGRRREVCEVQNRGVLVKEGQVDLSTKFSKDGRNCQSLLNGASSSEETVKEDTEREPVSILPPASTRILSSEAHLFSWTKYLLMVILALY